MNSGLVSLLVCLLLVYVVLPVSHAMPTHDVAGGTGGAQDPAAAGRAGGAGGDGEEGEEDVTPLWCKYSNVFSSRPRVWAKCLELAEAKK